MTYNYGYFRKYYLANKEKLNNYRKEWGKKNLHKNKKYKSKWLKNNLDWVYRWEKSRDPIIRKAYWTVKNALRRGRLKKEKCKVCGSQKVHAHHSDYNKPLSVIWLCPFHHKQIDIKKPN